MTPRDPLPEVYALDATAVIHEAWMKLADASATAKRMWRYARAWLQVELPTTGPA